MKILITGASGYIGEYLIKYLSESGYYVGALGRKKTDHIDKFSHNFYNFNLLEKNLYKINEDYDFLIHLAGGNEIDCKCFSNAIDLNLKGTQNVLDFCVLNGIKNIIFFSTIHVLGILEGNISNNTIPNPLNNYALSNFYAEKFLMMKQRIVGSFNYLIIRPTNIFGNPITKSKRTSLIPTSFCIEALKTNTITVKSSGKTIVDFIYVKDLCSLVESFIKNKNISNNIVNVSSNNQFTVFEIANLVKEEYQKLYNKNCETLVKGTNPPDSNIFKIRNDFDFKFENREYIKIEIKNILKTYEL